MSTEQSIPAPQFSLYDCQLSQDSVKFCNTPPKYLEFLARFVNLSIRLNCFHTEPKGKIQNTVLPHHISIKKLKPGGKFDEPHRLTQRSLSCYVKRNNIIR